tara:strand:+ start:168 stop:446 length:279 start_codon:yes stop_codon:yes gene_type:complete
MANLLDIAESILDGAVRETNLASAEAVQAYADFAFDCEITDKEANQVRNVCLAWVKLSANSNIPGSQEYFETVTSQLQNAESEKQTAKGATG